MLLTVPLAGELSFYPFNETFRVSFGVPAFFFFLLLLQNTPAIFSGILTGTMVVIFRILIDFFMQDNFSWISAFHAHYPSFSFILPIPFYSFCENQPLSKPNFDYWIYWSHYRNIVRLRRINLSIYCVGNNDYVWFTK